MSSVLSDKSVIKTESSPFADVICSFWLPILPAGEFFYRPNRARSIEFKTLHSQ